MPVYDATAVMPQFVIDEPMLESMRARIGQELRIEHSIQNDAPARRRARPPA